MWQAAPVVEAPDAAAPTSVVAAVVAAPAPVAAAGPGSTVMEWKSADVSAWLASIELPQHAESFKTQSVDGPMLLVLTEEDLYKSLGVTSPLHRKKIVMAVGELRKAYMAP